jgi:hypothetical protein
MGFLYEGMAARVQDFVTIRFGSMWVDVPMGPIQASNSAGSLQTTATSPAVVAHDQEVNSKAEEGFTPVMSKVAKRRARRVIAKARVAATNECAANWHKATPTNSTPDSSKYKGAKPSSSMMTPKLFHPITLGEWPICARKAPPTKSTVLMVSSSSPKEKEAMPPAVTHEKQGSDSSTPSPSILGAPPRNSTSTKSFPPPNGGIVLQDQPQGSQPHGKQGTEVEEEINRPRPIDKRKAVMAESDSLPKLHSDPSCFTDQHKMIIVGKSEVQVAVTSATMTVERFLRDVRGEEPKPLIVGLDTEWFENDRKRIALIQICVDKKCLLFKVGIAGDIPDNLKSFLADEDHVFVGVAIANDLDRLREGHQIELSNKVELQAMAPFIISDRQWNNVPSLATLAQELLGVAIGGKGTNVRYKHWDNKQLTENQIKYACTDVVVPYMVGDMIQKEYGCDLHVTQSPYPSTNSMDNNEDGEVQRSQLHFVEDPQTKRIKTCPACPAGAKQKNRMWNEVISHVVSQAASEKGSEDNRRRHKCLLRNHGFHVETSDDSGSNPEERGEAVEEINPRHPANEEKAMTMENSLSSTDSDSSTKSRLRVEAPEFIPMLVHNPSNGQPKYELRWQGLHLSFNDITRGHVDPAASISDPISSEVVVSWPSAQNSTSPKRRRRRQRNIHKAWANFNNSIDSLTNAQRAYVADSILAQQRGEYRRIQNAAMQAFQASIERTICQDLRSLLPGASTSSDNVEGELMRRAKALAKLPEHHEFIKKDPRRRKYAKQAANVCARRASLKQRELAIPTNSMASKAQRGVSSNHAGGKTIVPYLPPHKRALSNRFEVLSSMPVSVEEEGCNTSDASSTSAHFKRKKPRKQVPMGHRPVTRSLTNSGNSENNMIYVGSYNPLFDDHSNFENKSLDVADSTNLNPSSGEDPQTATDDDLRSPHSEGEPSESERDAEQVLTTNQGQSVEEQMNQMMAALQQKEEELAALREQVANTRNRTSDANASTSQGGPPPHPPPEISLKSIQRMISEGVRAQYMQTHYSMRPGYVKPYPSEVDMVPFPSNYR